MIKVAVNVNKEFWRTAKLPGINKQFQVKVIEPDGKTSMVDCFAGECDDFWVDHDYKAEINNPSLEPDPDNPYMLRRK